MTHRYGIIIFWSDEDQAFVADIPELPGCMAHGFSHAQQAVALWLEMAREHGDTIPEPRGRRLLCASRDATQL